MEEFVIELQKTSSNNYEMVYAGSSLNRDVKSGERAMANVQVQQAEIYGAQQQMPLPKVQITQHEEAVVVQPKVVKPKPAKKQVENQIDDATTVASVRAGSQPEQVCIPSSTLS